MTRISLIKAINDNKIFLVRCNIICFTSPFIIISIPSTINGLFLPFIKFDYIKKKRTNKNVRVVSLVQEVVR